MKKFEIIKENGEKVVFQREKLLKSLTNAGASKLLAEKITEEIETTLHQNITTKQIYKESFLKLKKQSRVSASRYKLKKAIMELGPTGFPFEKFVGKILEQEGFQTEVGVIVKGHCVTHEVDVAALKNDKHYMIECKYHSDKGRFCNVKIPLYIQSRFIDVERQWKKQPGHDVKFHQGWVFTNTRFTTDAIQYAECMGLGLTSWDYPKNNSLKNRIDSAGLHPLTSLTTLTRSEKSKLLDKGIVLCKELHDAPNLLNEIGVDKTRHKKILEDSEELCKNH